MDFQEAFIDSLHSNTMLTKNVSFIDYLPYSMNITKDVLENIPYVQAYRYINATYPYFYEISNLDFYCLMYTEGGQGAFINENCNLALQPGSLAIVNCKERHRVEIKQSPWNYKVFFIKGNPIPYLYNVLTDRQIYIHTFSLSSSIPNNIQNLFMQLSKNSDNHFMHAKLILDIVLDIVNGKNTSEESDTGIPKYLIHIKQYIEDHYKDDVTLDTLEQNFHMSKYRICHEFKKQFGISPIQYLYQKKIEVAKDALTHTDKRINEIGRLIGFENTNHFIRLFKKQIGVTPLSFRKQSPIQ